MNLTVIDLGNQETAGRVFRVALAGESGERTQALALIRDNREVALQALERGRDTLGLTPKGEHDSIELILSDPRLSEARARELLSEDHFTTARLAEIVNGGGDLGSIVAAYAPIVAIIKAALLDFGGAIVADSIQLAPLFVLRMWATKLKERSDFDQFLTYRVGEFTIREWLILAVWFETCNENSINPEDEEAEEVDIRDIPSGVFEELGLEVEAEELISLIGRVHEFSLPSFDEIEDAKRDLAERERGKKEMLATVEARDDATRAASKISL